jgi:hypothetical protein
MTGRTSMVQKGAVGRLAARSVDSSMLSALMSQMPPRCSFDSMNGQHADVVRRRPMSPIMSVVSIETA